MKSQPDPKSGGNTFWRWIVFLALLPLLYLLSAGPAVYLRECGLLSKNAVRTCYQPLIGFDSDHFDAYLSWWVRQAGKSRP